MAKAKKIKGIDCDGPAAEAIRLVLTARLEEMCAMRQKALDWSDPEGVHDMRVASRRLRSALRDFTPYLGKRRLEASLQEIKRLADALGEVRDQDVAIIALEKVSQKAPAKVVTGIQEFVELHKVRRDAARKELRKVLGKRRVARLQTQFVGALDAGLKVPPRPMRNKDGSGRTGTLAYREVARLTILERLSELEKLSTSLYHPMKVKPLHKMRIAAKRLRYALQFFEQCWGKSIASFAPRVARLQTSLGELHDCDVWIENFGTNLLAAERRSAKAKVELDDEKETALVWLLTHFVKLRTKHFRNALVRWSKWEANNLSADLRKEMQGGGDTVRGGDRERREASSRLTSP